MTVVEYFDPYNLEHLMAFREFEKTGALPAILTPSGVEFPLVAQLWQVELYVKLAKAWLKEYLAK